MYYLGQPHIKYIVRIRRQYMAANRICCSRSKVKVTESHAKPYFIFLGVDQYRNTEFSTDRLFMLGVKTSCKDRWRQVKWSNGYTHLS